VEHQTLYLNRPISPHILLENAKQRISPTGILQKTQFILMRAKHLRLADSCIYQQAATSGGLVDTLNQEKAGRRRHTDLPVFAGFLDASRSRAAKIHRHSEKFSEFFG
jgi:hypothetical protein